MDRDREFERFCESQWPALVRALAWASGADVTAEDLAQETMVRVYENWDRVRGLERPEGWMYQVGLNLSRSRWRLRKRRLPDAGRDLVRFDDDVVEQVMLRRAVAGLSPALRDVLIMRHVVGWTPTEVAAHLGVSEEAVRVRAHRAAKAVRAQMNHEEEVHP